MSDHKPVHASRESEKSVQMARATAERTIQSAALSREVVRGTRLRLQIERLAERCYAAPPKTAAESARILEELLLGVMTCCEAPMGNLQVVDKSSGALSIRVHRGFQEPFLKYFAQVHEGAACATAFEQAGPVAVDDVATSPLYSTGARRAMLDAGARSCQSVALVPRGRKKLGVLSVHYRQPGVTEARRQMLAALAPQIGQVVELCSHP
ncbi:MAG TPA: GAF domain-containing protein [Opitutaceae bacterium]|nr:GAF domain-containing protein [Opitutaceae bacterium]